MASGFRDIWVPKFQKFTVVPTAHAQQSQFNRSGKQSQNTLRIRRQCQLPLSQDKVNVTRLNKCTFDKLIEFFIEQNCRNEKNVAIRLGAESRSTHCTKCSE